MKTRKIICLLLALFLISCSMQKKQLEGNTSSLLLRKDLTLQSLLVEDFMTDDLEGLKTFIEEEVSNFNKESENVKLEKIEYSEEKIRIWFSYTSLKKLLEYRDYSKDKSIGFSDIKVYTKEEFSLSEYANNIQDSKSKYFVVLEGAGKIFFESKILEVLTFDNAEVEILNDGIVVKDENAKLIIGLK